MLGLNDNVLQGQHLDAIRTMRPAANFILDPKAESSSAMKAAYPGAMLIGRPYVPDSEVHGWYLSGDPTQAGNRAAAICLNAHHANPAVDAWILLNEPPVASMEQIIKLAAFDIAFARAMKAGGSRGCIGAFARGTPQIPAIDGGAALRAYLPAIRVAEEVGALVAIHQYGFNPLSKDAEWNALRWQTHILPWLAKAGLSKFEYVITETGCDLGTGQLENGQVMDGWKVAFGDTPEGREAYANQLLWLVREYAKDPRCRGVMLFCAGNQNRWGTFDVSGEMLSRLMAVQWPPIATTPPPVVPPTIPPKPPSGGGTVTQKHLTPQSKHFSSREGRAVQYLILHTTESPVNSDQKETLDYLVQNSRKVSINDYIALFPDGIIHLYNMVPYSHAAHHAGGAEIAPGVFSSQLPNGFRGHECNMRTIGLEIYRRVDQAVPAAVVEASAQWAAERCKQYNLQTSQILSHAQVDPTRRSDPIGINMVAFRDRVGEILGAMVQVPPPAERLPLPEDEPLIDLTTFLQKSTYWMEEEIRQYQQRQFARATAIRLSLAKYMAKGRDRWSQ
jgi:hypothetical protein